VISLILRAERVAPRIVFGASWSFRSGTIFRTRMTLARRRDDRGALGDEQLGADVEHADVVRDRIGQRKCGHRVQYIERRASTKP